MAQIPMRRQGGDAQATGPYRRPIPETIQDLWHQHGVATERVEKCKACEQHAFMPTQQAGPPLPAQARNDALRCMRSIINTLGMSFQEWSQAVCLFDIYSLMVTEEVLLLPTTCLCMVRLVKKFDKTESVRTDFQSTWLPIARRMVPGMAMSGREISEITENILNSHELQICQAINWQIDVMTVDRWISMFSTRFNVLTENQYQLNIMELVPVVHALIMYESASLQFSNYSLALGVFILSLAKARLIPFGVLQPLAIGHPRMDAAFAPSELDGRIPGDALMDNQLSSMVGIIEAVTCCELHVLQQASQHVIQTLTAAQLLQLATA